MMTTATRLCWILTLAASSTMAQSRRPNILFIAVDDLKPVIGAYGGRIARTPNLDKLASTGTVFLANYCQQAVCGPTRASLMTGMRPDYTKVWDLKTRMRDINPNIVSLPQYLRTQGYSTQGIGKVYDPRCVDEQNDAPSWSVPYHKTGDDYYASAFGKPVTGRYQHPDNKAAAERFALEAQQKGLSKAATNDYLQEKVKPAVESADVPDNAYTDGANVLQAIDILGGLAREDKPFFFAVGLSKPHLPFVSPKRYWDLYRREDMPLADFTTMPKGAPAIAMHNSGEIRSYTDVAPLIDPATEKGYGLTLTADKQRELLHGYYAAVSYLDANVGRLMRALDSLGLRNNTIIVLWGDHGWHLGDHNLWCKHSNFEQATRAPLIISAPGVRPSRTKSPSEFVDVFPTLCELAGVPLPAHLHGKSLVTTMKSPTHRVKEYSVSQYPRSGNLSETQRLGYADGKVMGYSIRNDRYRYTLWMGDGWKSWMAYNPAKVVGVELYDYKTDPGEHENIAARPAMAAEVRQLQGLMEEYFRSQKGMHQ
jgi:iduronate 2-sulfatase